MTEAEVRRIVREEIEAVRQDQSAINKASINAAVRDVVVNAVSRQAGILFVARPARTGDGNLTPEASTK
ncbi:hypothetical protein AruPA_15265 [Acidiphilium sp. PA]|uniref:hypothetical protein n=1 Tax=Acidiphilium sp. PA TaxID=2871705 RepID=UPI0022434587|nr:hypothetical protein [Acidiphilium sp. PA]MCW8308397.1 hypothetical protein [Acidiphilium sp. PA]